MNRAHVFQGPDLARLGALCTALGAVCGIAAAGAFVALYVATRPAPAIVERSASRTVARIVTRDGAAERLCTVTIDHRQKLWAVTC